MVYTDGKMLPPPDYSKIPVQEGPRVPRYAVSRYASVAAEQQLIRSIIPTRKLGSLRKKVEVHKVSL